MKLSEIREAMGNNTIVNDLKENDSVMAFIGTDNNDDSMNVKVYIDGNPEYLVVLLAHCITENENLRNVVVNAVRMYNLRLMDKERILSGED